MFYMENQNNENNGANTNGEFAVVDRQNPNANFGIIENRSPEILQGDCNKLLEVLGGNRDSMYLNGNQLVHIIGNNEPNLQNNNFDVENTPNTQNNIEDNAKSGCCCSLQ